MQTDAYRLWSTRIVTFTVSGLAVASAVYWGLKGWSPVVPSTAQAVMLVQASLVTPQAVARALGGGLVDEGVMLQSVTGRRAVLTSGNANSSSFTLELPPLEK